jgi:hypothetical protein
MGTAFWNELAEDGFFKWVGWGRLFQMSWMKITFSNELNKNVFFEWVEWKCPLWMRIICPRFRAQRVVRALSVCELIYWLAQSG